MKEIKSQTHTYKLKDFPTTCPYCHRSITPNPLFGHYNTNEMLLEVFLTCPDDSCNESFIAKYMVLDKYLCEYTGEKSQGTLIGKTFPDTINNISKGFSLIYTESYIAEQLKLLEICGVGYRKALEFLIKDYAIKNNPNKKEEIEKKLLAQCIGDHVNDVRIKTVAKRAVWLGNDETHYVRKWEGKNLADLKKLIDLTIHWIEMEELTASFEDEMPEQK